MKNNLDVSALLAKLNNGELAENINRLSRLLNTTETNETENDGGSAAAEKSSVTFKSSTYIINYDPNINLLIAITPFLSERKRNKAEMLLKPLNLLYFLRQFNSIAEQTDHS